MKELLTKEEIIEGLKEIGKKAKANNLVIDIAIYGGAALSIAYNLRNATKDVDAVVKGDKQEFKKIVESVAEEKDWSNDWLNDAVKGFLSNEEELRSTNYEIEGLRIYVPTPEYIFAMKCMAMRSDEYKKSIDMEDIKNLSKIIGIKDKNDAFKIIEKFYPKNRIMPKTLFGIEEIMDNINKEVEVPKPKKKMKR